MITARGAFQAATKPAGSSRIRQSSRSVRILVTFPGLLCLRFESEFQKIKLNPTGLNATAAYVHSKGLKFGLWFGHSMCAPSNDSVADGAPDYATLDVTPQSIRIYSGA